MNRLVLSNFIIFRWDNRIRPFHFNVCLLLLFNVWYFYCLGRRNHKCPALLAREGGPFWFSNWKNSPMFASRLYWIERNSCETRCCILFNWFIISFRFLWWLVNSLLRWMVSVIPIHKTCPYIVLVQFISYGAQLANAVHYHISHDKFSVPCWEVKISVFVGMQVPLPGHESALERHMTPRGVDRGNIHPRWGTSTFLYMSKVVGSLTFSFV